MNKIYNYNIKGTQSKYLEASNNILNLKDLPITKFKDKCFSEESLVEEYILPETLLLISPNLFQDNTYIERINIPKSVTSIGDYAFDGCYNLVSITFEENSSLKTIGNYSFADCWDITSIKIPDTVTTIGNYAFNGCNKLETIEIGNNVATIGDYAFESCSIIKDIILPESVVDLGNHAFGDDTKNSITFGPKLNYKNPDLYRYGYFDNIYFRGTISQFLSGKGYGKYLSTYALQSSGSNLYVLDENGEYKLVTEWIVSDSLAGGSLTGYGFYGIGSLTYVEIPWCHSIDREFFTGCYNLRNIRYGGTKESWRTAFGVYSYIPGVPTVYVSCTNGSITLSTV